MYDAFVEKLVAATAALTVGDGMQDGITIGPLVNTRAVSDVDKLVQASIAAGARVALGGGPHALGGCFYQPTVLTGVTPDMARLPQRDLRSGRTGGALLHRGRGHRHGQ